VAPTPIPAFAPVERPLDTDIVPGCVDIDDVDEEDDNEVEDVIEFDVGVKIGEVVTIAEVGETLPPIPFTSLNGPEMFGFSSFEPSLIRIS